MKDMANDRILTAEQEMKLRQPIDDYIGKIQKKIDSLRADGTDQVVTLQNTIDGVKRDRTLTKGEKENRLKELHRQLEKAKSVEAANKDEVSKLISQGVTYLNNHFDKEYFQPVKESCIQEKAEAKEKYNRRIGELAKEHQEIVSKLSAHQEVKDENYVYKNRRFDAKMELEKDYQAVKDRKHAAYTHKYHLIDMLRMSRFTFMEARAQKWENYKYTFNRRQFLLRNGLYIAIILVFIRGRKIFCVYGENFL